MVAPILDELADEYEGRVAIVKVNGERAPLLVGWLVVRASYP